MRQYVLQQLATLPRQTKTPLIYGSTCIVDVFKTLGLTNPAPVKQLEKFLQKIVPVPYDEREKHYPFTQKYYMRGIDKAFLVVTQLARRLASPKIIPTNANINQGLLLGLMARG